MIHIFDCSGIYQYQNFYRDFLHQYHDLTSISGLSCYCDDDNFDMLKSESSPENGTVSFIDSGNYHYLSYFHLLKSVEDFRLVLFDNHPDAKEANFPLLSCGSWVLDSIRTVQHLKEIEFIGTDPKLMMEVKTDILKEGFSEEHTDEKGRRYLYTRGDGKGELPVFLSIDKDVLSKEYAFTSWSHGTMSLEMLMECLSGFLVRRRVLGIDICGETDCESALLSEGQRNERANRELLKWIMEHWKHL